MLQKLILLGIAGALGTISRYGLAGLVQKVTGAQFPWGTLIVNLTGCFLAGFLWASSLHRLQLTGEARIIILVGFMGAFTTFSTYMLETGELMRNAEWVHAFWNLFLHSSIGLIALFTGIAIGRHL